MSPPSRLEAVLFDLDGTLIDTAPDFAAVLNQLCTLRGVANTPYEDIRSTVSMGSKALVTLAFSIDEKHSDFASIQQQLLDLYEKNLAVESKLFDGMETVLDWLERQQLPWGIVTNKPRRYAEAIISALKLSDRCGTLICPDDVINTKPDAEPMLLACRQLSCNATSTVYVGDHRRDIEAGKNAAMTTIAANYGYIEASDPAIDWQADFYIDQPIELKSLLTQHFNIN